MRITFFTLVVGVVMQVQVELCRAGVCPICHQPGCSYASNSESTWAKTPEGKEVAGEMQNIQNSVAEKIFREFVAGGERPDTNAVKRIINDPRFKARMAEELAGNANYDKVRAKQLTLAEKQISAAQGAAPKPVPISLTDYKANVDKMAASGKLSGVQRNLINESPTFAALMVAGATGQAALSSSTNAQLLAAAAESLRTPFDDDPNKYGKAQFLANQQVAAGLETVARNHQIVANKEQEARARFGPIQQIVPSAELRSQLMKPGGTSSETQTVVSREGAKVTRDKIESVERKRLLIVEPPLPSNLKPEKAESSAVQDFLNHVNRVESHIHNIFLDQK